MNKYFTVPKDYSGGIMKKNVIIIGGVAGGTSAAASAKRLNSELNIKIFDAKEKISVGACSFPSYIGGLINDPKKLYQYTPNSFFNKFPA